jgi:uncharacterized protein with HEPN domain
VQAGREEFFRNVIYQDAAMRNLEIIGEAAKRIPPGWWRAAMSQNCSA